MRMTRISAAFAGITAGFLTLAFTYLPGATAAPHTYPDCRLVAPADRTLCNAVSKQGAYAYATKGRNLVYVPNGRVLVTQEVTHAGLTRQEMHSALIGYARDYAAHVTHARSVTVDLDSLRRAYGTDAEYVVGFTDADGRPGGKKDDRVEINW